MLPTTSDIDIKRDRFLTRRGTARHRDVVPHKTRTNPIAKERERGREREREVLGGGGDLHQIFSDPDATVGITG